MAETTRRTTTTTATETSPPILNCRDYLPIRGAYANKRDEMATITDLAPQTTQEGTDSL